MNKNIEKVDPFFEVTRKPLFVEIGDNKIPVQRDALIKNDDILGIVSKNYKLIDNREVAETFNKAFENNDISYVKDHLNASSNKWVREIVIGDEEYITDIKNNDIVKTKIEIFNGYDGCTSVGFSVSAWRQVCSNGMMGWQRTSSVNFTHMGNDIIKKIKSQFEYNFNKFKTNFLLWKKWANIGFSETDFYGFIDNHTKQDEESDNKTKYLSKKQAGYIKVMYPTIMNDYNEEETIWGGYNVLTAIATHYTKARNGSNIFSAAYRRMNRLVQDYYEYNNN